MKFKKLMIIGVFSCLSLISCSNSSQNKKEISLSDAKKYVKSKSEFKDEGYLEIKVTSTIKDVQATGEMASILGSSLSNYVGVTETQTISYKENYSDYVVSLESLEALESSNIDDYNILDYKIYKTDDYISCIEASMEQSVNMNYGGYSIYYKIELTSIMNYNKDGFITSFISESTFTYSDNSSIYQKTETTIEYLK